MKSRLRPVTFGAITKFSLPTPVRSPNAVAVAPDGSVWFGEIALPGVGHLFSNGTLLEYRWPFNYPAIGGDCTYRTDIWGIALWNGKVWASDTTGNQLVGLDPTNDTIQTAKVPSNQSFPYALTVAPDNKSLWFPELETSKLGELSLNGSISEHVVTGGKGTPAQVAFANNTLGYYVNVGGFPGKAPAGVFSFDPAAEHFASSQTRVGGNHTLYSPDSIALGDGGFWVAQHGASSVIFYSFKNGNWTVYPTSTVSYVDTTLPHFVATSGSQVWFNEHYANRMAMLDSSKGTLTEYSLANPPVTNGSLIENALTFALGKGSAWFTEWTANYVGFVDTSIKPSFSVKIENVSAGPLPPHFRLHLPTPGASATLRLLADGNFSQPISVQFSDSESFTSIPKNISMSSSPSSITSLSGRFEFVVTIKAENRLLSGNNYMALMTLNSGLVLQSAYVELEIEGQ